MTLAYVTLYEVKQHLNIMDTDDTQYEYLNMLIASASAIVKNHMGDKSVYQAARNADDEPELDSNFEPVLDSVVGAPTIIDVRYEIKSAVLLLIGELYLNREGAGNFRNGMLPVSVAAILYPLRDPQLK